LDVLKSTDEAKAHPGL